MSQINIVEVESRAQLKDFIKYPYRLYEGDPNYVAPLISERLEFFNTKTNPFFKTARTKMFLAFKDGEITGRIATIVNYAHNQYHEEKVGFFGFFDCEDDFEVASQLFKVAMIVLKKEGMEKMRGPANFSTNHEVGFLIEGFDSPPTIMMTYNQPYLPKLAEKFGLKKAMDLVAYKLSKDNPVPERIANVVSKLQKRTKIKLRNINMFDFDNEIDRINQVYNQAWAPNWGFVPMNEEEFTHMAKSLKQIIEPKFTFIAEFEDKPVAFLIGLPDINQALIHLKGKLFPFGLMKLFWHTKIRNKIDGLRLITMGVIPKFQKRGIDSMLYLNCYQAGIAKGYTWGELSWVLETNELMRRAIEAMGGKVYKRYRMVEMPI